MKTKTFAAWLAIPFAAAIASDSGAPVAVLALIAFGWCAGTFALLERYRRREENKRQRSLSECRRRSRKAG